MDDKKYKYQCTVCGEVVELDEPMPDDYICPICGVDASQFVEVKD